MIEGFIIIIIIIIYLVSYYNYNYNNYKTNLQYSYITNLQYSYITFYTTTWRLYFFFWLQKKNKANYINKRSNN